MSSTATELTGRLRAAHGYMTTHGWTQGEEQDERGRVCLTGAVRLCRPVDGDEQIIRQVLRQRRRAEDWNDANGRAAEDVLGFLAAAEVTDADLADTFGPQWEAVVRLVRQAATLTSEQANRRDAAWDAARNAAWDVAWDAARNIAWGAARGAARDAAWDAAWDAARNIAWGAARDAAWALVVADLVGHDGLTQDHVDTLLAPWVSVMGDPRVTA